MSDVHVQLRIGTETFALDVANVLEVAELGELTTVPGSGAGLLGVRNFHGQVLPVFDLAEILDSPRGGRPPRLVVADQAGRLAGLAVDEVTEVAPLVADGEDVESEYLKHAVLEEGVLIGVIDVDRLFSALGGQER